MTAYSAFASPTGNITCGLHPEGRTVRCDIGERAWDAPPKPADCELDWGSGLVLSDDTVDFVCAGDAVGAPEYGEAITGGGIVCSSAETGMTCKESGSGHGFRIARASYTIF